MLKMTQVFAMHFPDIKEDMKDGRDVTSLDCNFINLFQLRTSFQQ